MSTNRNTCNDHLSPEQRIDALVKAGAAIEMELQATQEELEWVIRDVFHGTWGDRVLSQSRARIAAKLANPDEGESAREH